MTYRITLTVALKGTYIGFSDYIDSLPFSTIQEKYPEMTEADWNAARVEIITYVKGRSSLPGVTSFTETFTEDGNGITHVWEWADEKAYEAWQTLPIQIEMEEKYDVSFALRKRVTLLELKPLFAPVITNNNVLLGRYLMALYHVDNDTIQTITAESI